MRLRSLRSIPSMTLNLALALLGVLVIGVGDYLTGYEFGFAVFYLLPVAGSAWWIGRRSALLVSGFSTLAAVLSDSITGHTFTHPILLLWDAFAKLIFFLVIGELLFRLRRSLAREREMAHTDALTGLANRRSFEESALREIERLKRYHHPFTVALMDLDHFKEVNDTLGHGVGDRVLQAVSAVFWAQLRNTDLPGRWGGDEFVILFPETNEKRARHLIPEIHRRLQDAMRGQHWPVTFSIGAVTFRRPPEDVQEMMEMPDKLMYRTKEAGRNGIAYGLH